MRVPVATYRLQFGDGFGFEDARKAVAYFSNLGISHVYASPIFTSRPGTSGYHVVDPTAIDSALGGRDGFEALIDELRGRGMGLMLDIVPNHMAASSDNQWWMDVLRRGQESKYASFFDVDWDRKGGKVLVPALGASLEEALERDELSVGVEGGEPVVRYHDHVFPVDPSTVAGADTVDELLRRQHYILASWRAAAADVNYRRFFDISDLVSLRQEDPKVFEATHALVFELVGEGRVTALRVDHVDGLRDPQDYLERLRTRVGPDVPIYVEKILGSGEKLPGGWPVQGATGYEFAAAMDDLFVDPDGFQQIEEFTRSLTRRSESFEEVAVEEKRLVLRELFEGQVRALADDLSALVGTRGPSPEELAEALNEVTACLPVYRTYIRDTTVPKRDRKILDRAFLIAESRLRKKRDREALSTLRRVLLLQRDKARSLEFVLRWQQLTGPVSAKGVEDTALYEHVSLASRDDVGNDPGSIPGGVDAFHRWNKTRARKWPVALSGTSTHDSKRGEDVRARIEAISEMPAAWRTQVPRWRRMLAAQRGERDLPGPDPTEELLFLQTLLGVWPLEEEDERGLADRLEAYMVKAAREAKRHTSWLDPDRAHERALAEMVRTSLGEKGRLLREDLAKFRAGVEMAGAMNSLASTLLKIAAPGVPDFYQGTERWSWHLVDPDNRRPVDFEATAAALQSSEGAKPTEVLKSWRDGRIKQLVIARGLAARGAKPAVFTRGTYVPLRVSGEQADRVVAFARRHGDDWVVAATPRLVASLTTTRFPVGASIWKRTSIPLPEAAPTVWIDQLTGHEVTATGGTFFVGEIFRSLPLVLLMSSRKP